jgi:hypothetical protein
MEPIYPWRKHSDLQTIIETVRPVFMAMSLIESGAGSSEDEITKAEKRWGVRFRTEFFRFGMVHNEGGRT